MRLSRTCFLLWDIGSFPQNLGVQLLTLLSKMASKVLYRVCYGSPNPEPWQSRMLTIKPAILHDFRRHKVRYCDYPAIIPQANSNVRGTFVTGLTEGDICRLDLFEGREYTRSKVKVRVLAKVGDDSGKGNIEGEEVEAETYVWTSEENDLEHGEWDFGEFVREKLAWWAGTNDEYKEVDEAMRPWLGDSTGGSGTGGNINGV
ncbi:hypothetical protein GP486_002649 [Trichoglossum hirsutum]|uniref:Putative gamma-glutamylcyclotransferase n=1 Tax=Trichoglossum hirsutum TaxID=265104 RepID=A0A9P8LEN3_9PEZI|nr:hypothetical protein GP486_002649 [Trichoglossum hirsutum]